MDAGRRPSPRVPSVPQDALDATMLAERRGEAIQAALAILGAGPWTHNGGPLPTRGDARRAWDILWPLVEG